MESRPLQQKQTKQTQCFSNHAIAVQLIPYLTPEDFCHYSLINKSTGKIAHLLNTSVKFKKNILPKILLKSLQNDAKQLLENNPTTATDAESKTIKQSLQKLASGDFEPATLEYIKNRQWSYQNEIKEKATTAASSTLRFTADYMLEDDRVLDQNDFKFAFLMLIISGSMYTFGWLYGAINQYFVTPVHDRFLRRLTFFQDNVGPEIKEDKPSSSQEDAAEVVDPKNSSPK